MLCGQAAGAPHTQDAAERAQLCAAQTLELDACCATARHADGGATVAVGTYTLRPEEDARVGALYLFDTSGSDALHVSAHVRWCRPG